MATSSRHPWLSVSGKLKCMSNPITGELDVSGLMCEVIDADGGATAIFAKSPDHTTWMTSDISHSATTALDVRSTTGWPTTGSLWVDSETIVYSGVTATQFTGLTRGALTSLAQGHYIGTASAARYPEVTSSIASIGGCRARLYVYGENDDPQGNGTQIWLGVVTKHPSFDGKAWRIAIDPITSILSKTLAADMQEPSKPRGIKYDWANRFSVTFERGDTGARLQVSFPNSASDRGFFENNDDFASYFNGLASAEITSEGWTSINAQIRVVPSGDDGYVIGVVSDSTIISVVQSSGFIDPVFLGPPTTITGGPVSPYVSGAEYYFVGQPSSVAGAGSVPRGYLGLSAYSAASDLAPEFPLGEIFIGGATVSSEIDMVAGSWKAFFYDESEDVSSILETRPATNSLILDLAYPPGFDGAVYRAHAWTASSLPELRLGRTYVADSTLHGALFSIINLAPTLLNKGGVPDLRSGDLDDSWTLLDTTSQPRVISSRRFTSLSDAELMTVVRNDLLLAGFMMGTSNQGKIAIAPIRNIVDTEAVAFEVAHPVVTEGVPTWEPTAYGMVNQVAVSRGYNGLEDEYTAQRLIIQNVAQFGRNPRPRTVTIEPKSTPAGPVESYAECVEVAQRVFSAYAGPYAIVNLKAPLAVYDTATIGAVGSITSPHLPDYESGTRGVTAKRMQVTGREVDLNKGVVTLRLYAPTNMAGGYAPGARITAESNVSGDTWDLTLSSVYLDSGTDAADWFLTSDIVTARAWDSTSTTTFDGTVLSSVGLVVRVLFTGSAAGLTTGTWFLTSRLASSAISATQARYAFLGDASMEVAFVSGTRPARRFA